MGTALGFEASLLLLLAETVGLQRTAVVPQEHRRAQCQQAEAAAMANSAAQRPGLTRCRAPPRRNGQDKKARKMAKNRLGTLKRGKRKVDHLTNVIAEQRRTGAH